MLAVAVRAGASRAFGMFMVRHDAPAPVARVIAGGYFMLSLGIPLKQH
jgi:hypothetical protein